MVSLPDTRRGTITLSRKLLPAEAGLVGLAQVFAGDGERVIVTHGASLLSLVEVMRGTVTFPLASGEIAPPRSFLLALPPRTVLPMRFAGAAVRTQGVASFDSLVAGTPAMLHHTVDAIPLDLLGAKEVARGSVLATLQADTGVPLHVARARQLLHDALGRAAPVRYVARDAGIATETLTRAFQSAYHVSPKRYCHQARLFAAVLRLLSGKKIVETALEVGFNDVTRFYAQFRRLLGATPGMYAAIRKRQDVARERGR
ncbi:MAG: helix-turn-helix transcriptional regulator [Kofleriaceae bacterium]|nr:helix-turn-helix transcriptional regulator [Kofleriaceae bacterium]